METSATIGEIAKALQIFQAKVPAIKKDSDNPFYGSRYASLDICWETVRPLLNEAGLVLLQFPEGDDALTNVLIHSASGEWMRGTMRLYFGRQAKRGEEPRPTVPGSVTPQLHGISIAYGRRYAMGAILGLTTDEDTDGETSGVAASQTKKPDTQPSRPPADTRPPAATPQLGAIRQWLSSLPSTLQGKATHAVFGCHVREIPAQPEAALKAGIDLVQAAIKAGIKWDSHTLAADLEKLAAPQPASRRVETSQQAQGLKRELKALLDQLPASQVPDTAWEALDTLTTSIGVLHDWVNWAKERLKEEREA